MNASPEFADALIAEFRHRHNEKASRRNRPDYPDIGHFDTWIVDDICILSSELGAIESPIEGWVSGKLFKPTNEQYGVLPLTSIPDNCLLKDEASLDGLTDSLKYLARKMKSRLPFLPVSTRDEKRLFRELYSVDPEKKPSLDDMLEIWNRDKADGKKIFFKLKSHLLNYEKEFNNGQNIRNTMTPCLPNIDALRTTLTMNQGDVSIPVTTGSNICINDEADNIHSLRCGTYTVASITPATTNPLPYYAPRETRRVQIKGGGKRNDKLTDRKQRTCKICGQVCPGNGNRARCITLRQRPMNNVGEQSIQ